VEVPAPGEVRGEEERQLLNKAPSEEAALQEVQRGINSSSKKDLDAF
jgi:hypothetical protein